MFVSFTSYREVDGGDEPRHALVGSLAGRPIRQNSRACPVGHERRCRVVGYQGRPGLCVLSSTLCHIRLAVVHTVRVGAAFAASEATSLASLSVRVYSSLPPIGSPKARFYMLLGMLSAIAFLLVYASMSELSGLGKRQHVITHEALMHPITIRCQLQSDSLLSANRCIN